MRSTCFSWALALSLAIIASGVPVSADHPAPRARSFRPVVPIKQSVRGGLDHLRSQTVSVRIPPPPIPEQSPQVDEIPLKQETNAEMLPDEPTKADQPPAAETKRSEASSLPEKTETEDAGNPSEKKSAANGPTLSRLRTEAHQLASKKLRYVFGADDPDSGGLDCSSTIQYLLTKIGVSGVPRTSYDQYDWLKSKKLLDDVYGKSASSKLLKKLSPGDLIFWGGTWKSGHRVSHVMLYMGYDPAADKHYVFGARSKSSTGLTGSGVDIFELDTEAGRLIAHGKIPGLIYE